MYIHTCAHSRVYTCLHTYARAHTFTLNRYRTHHTHTHTYTHSHSAGTARTSAARVEAAAAAATATATPTAVPRRPQEGGGQHEPAKLWHAGVPAACSCRLCALCLGGAEIGSGHAGAGAAHLAGQRGWEVAVVLHTAHQRAHARVHTWRRARGRGGRARTQRMCGATPCQCASGVCGRSRTWLWLVVVEVLWEVKEAQGRQLACSTARWGACPVHVTRG